MTLLSIIQDACDVIGLDRPAAVVGGTDQNARTMLAVANREGRELYKRYPWQKLLNENAFQIVTEDENQGELPVNFDRFVDESFWNITRRRQVYGPISQMEWQALTATTAPAVVDVWRIYQNAIYIKPTPTLGDRYSFLFVSKYWAFGGVGISDKFQSDEDETYLNEELITLGVIWRFLQSRGLEYGEARQTYETAVSREMARDGGRMRMQTGLATPWRPGIGVPEGDWNI